jgi:hypothetical protein
MKKLVLSMLLLAIALMMGANALAQDVGDNAAYFVTYFSNANTKGAPNAVVRFINDGDTENDLWADYYVFNDSQELEECCACVVTPDGLNSEYVNTELTANTVTGKALTRGVIKIISSSSYSPTYVVPTAGLRGFSTHVQATGGSPAYSLTETRVADSNLSASEQYLLQNLCAYAEAIGSGQGVCTCTPEDQDF